MSTMTACASGSSVIGDCFRMIRDGHADLMLASSIQDYLTPATIGGYFRYVRLAIVAANNNC